MPVDMPAPSPNRTEEWWETTKKKALHLRWKPKGDTRDSKKKNTGIGNKEKNPLLRIVLRIGIVKSCAHQLIQFSTLRIQGILVLFNH